MKAWKGRAGDAEREAAANGAKFKMKCKRQSVYTGTNTGNLIKSNLEGNLYRPTGHAAAQMINDSRDR